MAKSYKHYPSCPQVLLPIACLTTDMQMEEIIRKRRSVRQFGTAKCSIEELANILQLSYGITGEGGYANQDFKQYFRAVPSGGALYPLEVYVGALNVDEIATGVYLSACNRKYSEELFHELKNLNITWSSQANLNIADDPELLNLAVESGCIALFIGIESINSANLGHVNKPINEVNKYEEGLENTYYLWYAHLDLHGRFSLISGVLGKLMSKGKRLLTPLNFTQV